MNRFVSLEGPVLTICPVVNEALFGLLLDGKARHGCPLAFAKKFVNFSFIHKLRHLVQRLFLERLFVNCLTLLEGRWWT